MSKSATLVFRSGFLIVIGLLISSGCGKTPEKPVATEDSSGMYVEELPRFPEAKVEQNSGIRTSNKRRVPQVEPNWSGEAIELFDGKSLEGWETIEFGGEGDIDVDEGVISFEAGVTMTGISSTLDDLPKSNYQIELDIQKVEGTDFLCGLTFPVAESHCTFIAGGWGGSLIGLSCIDDLDASSNDSTTYMKFEKDTWYRVRLRVEDEKISAWVNGRRVISQNIAGKKISLRGDTDLCKPLGICSFMTSAKYKRILLRRMNAATSETTEETESK